MTGAARQALIVLTSHERLGDTGRSTGAYFAEVAHAWDVLAAAGYAVDLASIRGGQPPLEGMNLDDPVQLAFRDDPAMAARLAATSTPSQVEADHYEVLFLAGGHGAAWDFPHDAGLMGLIRRAYEHGVVVAAVCHGPAALVNVTLSDGSYLVDGRRVSSFTNDEERAVGMTEIVPFLLADELRRRGAIHVSGPSFIPHVVVDGHLVTGQNPASAALVAEEAVAAVARVRDTQQTARV